ncbi:MAG: sugar 3,4-ketoisomerase [Prevotella sp.]
MSKVINLPQYIDSRGSLTVAECMADIPFTIKRSYWVYGVPEDACRGGHAHKVCMEFIVAVKGCFTVTLDNGHERRSYRLDSPSCGLLVSTDTWHELSSFTSDAVCMVFSSHEYDSKDYIRTYEEFQEYIKHK